jgi:hypothetical protein
MTKQKSVWRDVLIAVGLLLGVGSALCAAAGPENRLEFAVSSAAGFALLAWGMVKPRSSRRGEATEWNFAQSSRLFILIGILAMNVGGGSMEVWLVALFSIGLGVLLGILSLFGVGRPADQPYKAPWISLSLGCSIVLIVGIGAMSAVLRGQSQGGAPVAGGPATAAFIDPVNGFRLDDPGHGWKVLSTEALRSVNEAAAVGAETRNLAGMVFVEIPDPDFRIAGREQEVGQQMLDLLEMDGRRVVFNRPDELDGQQAVRCQVVGTIGGRGVRYEVVALVANGRLYRLLTGGPSDQTAEDGLAFRPFMAAFHLLDEDFALKDADTYATRAYDWLCNARYDRALKDYDRAIQLEPDRAAFWNARGLAWRGKGVDDTDRPACEDRALSDYGKAIRLDPTDASAINNRAWLLATSKVDRCRDGKAAVEGATKACELTGWKKPGMIDTLSCAYAEIGDFEQAIRWQKKALEDTSYHQEGETAKAKLQLFGKKQPFRE